MKCFACGSSEYISVPGRGEVCKFCGAPKEEESNNQLVTRLSQVEELRNELDFDEAGEKLDNLLSDFPDNFNVNLQCLLNRYGISFVDEGGKRTHIPTINRLSETSIKENVFYKRIQEIGMPEYWQNKLDEIERINTESLAMVKKQDPYDIFICYKRTDTKDKELLTQDNEIANRIYRKLTDFGYKVFLAGEVLHTQYAGNVDGFEPVIYGAIKTAKVFLMIVASDKPEYYTWRWVKNEWSRFIYKVKNDDPDCLFFPVIAGKGSVSVLPNRIEHIQCLELNENFYEDLLPRIATVIKNKKLAGFKNVVVESHIEKVSLQSQIIEKTSFKKLQNRQLTSSEKTELDLAIDDMNLGYYDEGYERLTNITRHNPNSYEANLNKLFCDFSVNNYDAFVSAPLPVDNLEKINFDMQLTVSLAGDDKKGTLIGVFFDKIKRLAYTDLSKFRKTLGKDNLLMLLFSTFEGGELLTATTELEKAFRSNPVFLNPSHTNAELKDISTIAEDCFRLYYSNCQSNGAKRLCDLYLFLGKSLKDVDYIDHLLEINPNISDAYIRRFLLNNQMPGYVNVASYSVLADAIIASKVSFTKYEIEEHDEKKDTKNLYSLIIQLLKTGYKIKPESNNFIYCLFNSTVKYLKIDINEAIAELLSADILNSPETLNVFRSMGDHLLINGDFEIAKKYYEQCLIGDEYDLEARWGLFKVDLKFRSNYDFFSFEERLTNIDQYVTIIELFNSSDRFSGKTNVYREFYNALETQKRDEKHNFNKRIFAKAREKCIKDDHDDSLYTILDKLRKNLYVDLKAEIDNEDAQEARRVKEEKDRAEKAQHAAYVAEQERQTALKLKKDRQRSILPLLLVPILFFAVTILLAFLHDSVVADISAKMNNEDGPNWFTLAVLTLLTLLLMIVFNEKSPCNQHEYHMAINVVYYVIFTAFVSVLPIVTNALYYRGDTSEIVMLLANIYSIPYFYSTDFGYVANLYINFLAGFSGIIIWLLFVLINCYNYRGTVMLFAPIVAFIGFVLCLNMAGFLAESDALYEWELGKIFGLIIMPLFDIWHIAWFLGINRICSKLDSYYEPAPAICLTVLLILLQMGIILNIYVGGYIYVLIAVITLIIAFIVLRFTECGELPYGFKIPYAIISFLLVVVFPIVLISILSNASSIDDSPLFVELSYLFELSPFLIQYGTSLNYSFIILCVGNGIMFWIAFGLCGDEDGAFTIAIPIYSLIALTLAFKTMTIVCEATLNASEAMKDNMPACLIFVGLPIVAAFDSIWTFGFRRIIDDVI